MQCTAVYSWTLRIQVLRCLHESNSNSNSTYKFQHLLQLQIRCQQLAYRTIVSWNDCGTKFSPAQPIPYYIASIDSGTTVHRLRHNGWWYMMNHNNNNNNNSKIITIYYDQPCIANEMIQSFNTITNPKPDRAEAVIIADWEFFKNARNMMKECKCYSNRQWYNSVFIGLIEMRTIECSTVKVRYEIRSLRRGRSANLVENYSFIG